MVFTCGMCRVLVSEEGRSCLNGEKDMKKVRQINRGCIHKKRSDRVLTAYTQYVLGYAASEEFGGEVVIG